LYKEYHEAILHIKCWSENLKGRDHFEDLGVDGRIILELMLHNEGEKVWTRCIWLRTGTNVRSLWTR